MKDSQGLRLNRLPFTPSAREGFLPWGQRDNQTHSTRHWTDEMDSILTVTQFHSPGEEDTTHRIGPHGVCPWEQTASTGVWGQVLSY